MSKATRANKTIKMIGWLAVATILFGQATGKTANASESDWDADLLIVGGTESGWAAAIQAARMGVESIVLVNDIEWLGGQFTAEAVCAIDENRNVSNEVPFPRSGLFLELTEQIENFNSIKYGHAQPGNAWTARTTVRPSECEAIFRQMIKPYVQSGQIRIVNWMVPSSTISTNDDRLISVEFLPTSQQATIERLVVRAKLTIDASDWGDVIQLADCEYDFGPDAFNVYGEPSAPKQLDNYPITDMNPITYCLVIEETGVDQVIDRPLHFDDRRYFLATDLTESDYGELGWQHLPHRPFNPPWSPSTGVFYAGERTVYSQRRLIDSYGLELKEESQRDVILLNWSVQDYPLDCLPKHVVETLEELEPGASEKNIVEMTRPQRQIIFDDAKQHSLGMLYHLQTTVHDRMQVDHRAHSFRLFQLTSEFGTTDRLPWKPYIRESLRLKALYMMKEQDTRNRDGRDLFAEQMYYDGIACWSFVYDFHPTGRAFLEDDRTDNVWDIYIKPGRSWSTHSDRALFPLRSLIPIRVDGLLGCQKNLGYSSIVSSAIRLQDQCIAIGQATGATAALAIKNGIQPRAIATNATLLSELKTSLIQSYDGGTPVMLWPFSDLSCDDESFEAVNWLATHQVLPLNRDEIAFDPNRMAEEEWVNGMSFEGFLESITPLVAEDQETRGEYAIRLYEQIRNHALAPFRQLAVDDADDDGTIDQNDPAPFDPLNRSLPERPLGANEDGLPNLDELNQAIGIQFAESATEPYDSFELDSGARYDDSKGYGWMQSIESNHRQRGRYEETIRDRFLFTRSHATWERVLPSGQYRVTVCIGDATYTQVGQNVTIEGERIAENKTTTAGTYFEATAEVTITDGHLTLEIGTPDTSTNTCINWLTIERISN